MRASKKVTIRHIAVIVGAIALLLIVYFVFFNRSPMKTFSGNGFSFRYPTSTSYKYVRYSVPPEVFVANGKMNIDGDGCYEPQEGNLSPNKIVDYPVHGITYCYVASGSTALPGDPGGFENHQYYTTYHNGTYVTIEYDISYTDNCVLYNNETSACQEQQPVELKDISKDTTRSLGTLRFNK
jgi:hypothetical protein